MKTNIKYEIIELRGNMPSFTSHNFYIWKEPNKDILFSVLNCSSIAQENQIIADYLNIENDGIFQSLLYDRNTLKGKKNYLKANGYKVSGLKLKEINDLVYIRFEHFYKKGE